MFPRSFVICALVLLVVAVTIRAAEETEEVEARNPLLAAAIKILGKAFKWAAKNCIKDAANQCKSHWKDPGALKNCAGDWLKKNKGKCLIGGG